VNHVGKNATKGRREFSPSENMLTNSKSPHEEKHVGKGEANMLGNYAIPTRHAN